MDWVSVYFLNDVYGLVGFDGIVLYEYVDLCEGVYVDWDMLIYNYGCNEVVVYLIGSVLEWVECFYIDGLCVDVVVLMLYWDYSWVEGEWIFNE